MRLGGWELGGWEAGKAGKAGKTGTGGEGWGRWGRRGRRGRVCFWWERITSVLSSASILLCVTQVSTFSTAGIPTCTTLRGIFAGFLGSVIVVASPSVSYSLSTPAIDFTVASASLDCFCTSGESLCSVMCPRCHF